MIDRNLCIEETCVDVLTEVHYVVDQLETQKGMAWSLWAMANERAKISTAKQ